MSQEEADAKKDAADGEMIDDEGSPLPPLPNVQARSPTGDRRMSLADMSISAGSKPAHTLPPIMQQHLHDEALQLLESDGFSESVIEDLLKWMELIDFFRDSLRNNAMRKMVIKRLELVRDEPDTVLFHQGDLGDAFYVLVKGNASVLINGNEVTTYSAGDAFGERSLTSEEPNKRAATVVSLSPCVYAKLSKESYLELVENDEGWKSMKGNSLASRIDKIGFAEDADEASPQEIKEARDAIKQLLGSTDLTAIDAAIEEYSDDRFGVPSYIERNLDALRKHRTAVLAEALETLRSLQGSSDYSAMLSAAEKYEWYPDECERLWDQLVADVDDMAAEATQLSSI